MPTRFFFVLLLLVAAIQGFSQETEKLVVHFDFNRSALTAASVSQLDSLINTNRSKFLLTAIQLTGHCDQTGSDRYNDSLSLRRVETVKVYLQQKGLDSSVQLDLRGLGERQPLNDDRTAIQQALNRRVELTIYKKAATPVVAAPPAADTTAVTAAKEEQPGELTAQLSSNTVKEGSKIVLKNLNFQGGRHYLLPGSLPVLEELLEILKKQPSLKIEIQGHICCANGPDALDDDLRTNNLSVERARVIYEYLVHNGIAASRLTYKGFGSSRKLYPQERTFEERSMNRRVEIQVIAK